MTKKEFSKLRPGDKVLVRHCGVVCTVATLPYGTGITVNVGGTEKRYHHKNLISANIPTILKEDHHDRD